MKRLFLFVSFLFVFCVVTSMAQTITSAVDMIDRGGGNTPIIWRKFLGLTAAPAVPTLIDYSYAGYMNGEEEITVTNNTVYNVLDYGAVVGDGNSDTQAIKDALYNARNGGIVYFPPGKYDVLTGTDVREGFKLASNVVLRGSGAQGSDNGGSTIKMHNSITEGGSLFEVKAEKRGGAKRSVVGSFPRGSTYFDVDDSNSFIGKRFIMITADNLLGSDWDDHCSRPLSDMSYLWTHILDGIDIVEIAEIDYIVGNRVHVKVPLLTPLNSNYSVKWTEMLVGVGVEDLRFDGGLNVSYVHHEHTGRKMVSINRCAHSWVRRCRFSNTLVSAQLSASYASSIIETIVDGRFGHSLLV